MMSCACPSLTTLMIFNIRNSYKEVFVFIAIMMASHTSSVNLEIKPMVSILSLQVVLLNAVNSLIIPLDGGLVMVVQYNLTSVEEGSDIKEINFSLSQILKSLKLIDKSFTLQLIMMPMIAGEHDLVRPLKLKSSSVIVRLQLVSSRHRI